MHFLHKPIVSDQGDTLHDMKVFGLHLVTRNTKTQLVLPAPPVKGLQNPRRLAGNGERVSRVK